MPEHSHLLETHLLKHKIPYLIVPDSYKMSGLLTYVLSFFVFFAFLSLHVTAQQNEPLPDTLTLDSLVYNDSLQVIPDTLLPDSLYLLPDTSISIFPVSDSAKIDSTKTASSEMLSATVAYKAKDSIRFEVESRKVFMYQNADITYEDIGLKSARVDIDFASNSVFAEGKTDSTGKLIETPVFTEGDQVFESETMRYNFKTKKGLIRKVITEDGAGYLHGDRIKKMPDDNINIQSGAYTTCNLKHPHFEFRFKKAKVIPGKKIVTGPAYLTIADVPTPLYIPFGIFPNKTGQRSGIIIPSYGESSNRGFFFENGGYYWAINDNMDLQLTGDIYTRGSWSLEPEFRYKKRYKYNGTMRLAYAFNRIGEEGATNFQEDKGFSIFWSHRQDPKARPNSSFSASVNISSNSFNKYNPVSTNNYLSNTFQSSIAYQTNFNQKYFLTVNSSYTQNTLDRSVRLTMPQLNFNTNTFYPFKKKKREGQEKWYERITVKYSMNAENTISTYDTLLFDSDFASRMKNGMKHDIPISSSIKVLKYFNLSNSIRYTERWYSSTTRKNWVNDTLFTATDTTVGYVQEDTVYGFSANRDFSYTASLNTRLYGMFSFMKGPVKALRMVHNPSISFTYHPDFADPFWGYYYKYQADAEGEEDTYSIYENGIYGGPPEGVMGRVSFSLSNNLEMKVRSKKDTITGTKKVKLIDNFTMSMSYDMAKDSLNWSALSLSGRTTLFKNLQITYRSSWDPYIRDSADTKNLNKFEWDVNGRLFRLENTSWNVGLNFRLSSKDFEKKGEKTDDVDKPKERPRNSSQQEIDEVELFPERYVDWSIPWNLNVRYSLGYTANHRYPDYVHETDKNLIQSLSFSGDLSITKKWKVMFRSGYDFENGEITYTSIDIVRDLHCWEMSFNWVPMGFRKQWSFQINVKSSILQDLKLTKKKDWRDF